MSGRPPTQNDVGPADDSSRKRPFSSISTGDFSTPAPVRQIPWGSEHRQLQPSSTPSENYGGPPFSNSTLAPQPQAIKPELIPSKPPVAAMDVSMVDGNEVPDINDLALHK